MDLLHMKKMYAINRDAVRCGYHGQIIKYQNVSIELAVKIMYPDKFSEFVKSEEYAQVKMETRPLEILSVGCTGSGKQGSL